MGQASHVLDLPDQIGSFVSILHDIEDPKTLTTHRHIPDVVVIGLVCRPRTANASMSSIPERLCPSLGNRIFLGALVRLLPLGFLAGFWVPVEPDALVRDPKRCLPFGDKLMEGAVASLADRDQVVHAFITPSYVGDVVHLRGGLAAAPAEVFVDGEALGSFALPVGR